VVLGTEEAVSLLTKDRCPQERREKEEICWGELFGVSGTWGCCGDLERERERIGGWGWSGEEEREQPKSFARLASGVLLLQRHKTK
jgi:hypothetical protein